MSHYVDPGIDPNLDIDKIIKDLIEISDDALGVMEQTIQRYFDKYMASEMDRLRSDVQHQQAQGLKRSSSPMMSLAGASNPSNFEDPLTRGNLIGSESDSRLYMSAEDMVLFCKRQLKENQCIGDDIEFMSDCWREAAVNQIGKEKYDRISTQLHQDLACAYMDYRLSEMILKKMVHEQAPTSTIDYVVRKACEGTLFGVAQSLQKTPMQMRIDKEGEQILSPNKGTRVAARVMSVAMDAPMTGALTCWGSLLGVGALEVGMELAQPVLIAKIAGEQKQLTVEQILSREMFGSDEDEFEKFRTQERNYLSDYNVSVALSARLHNQDGVVHCHRVDLQWWEQNIRKEMGFGQDGAIFTEAPYRFALKDKDPNESVFSLGAKDQLEGRGYSPLIVNPVEEYSDYYDSDNYSTDYDYEGSDSDSYSSSFSSSSSTSSTETSTPSSTQETPLTTNPNSTPSTSTTAKYSDSTPITHSGGKDTRKTKPNADKDTDEASEIAYYDGGYEQNEINHTTSPSRQSETSSNSNSKNPEDAIQNNTSTPEHEEQQIASQWAPLIGQFGIKDIKSAGANLGLILATLPDMLFGIFSKKDTDQEYSWSKNLIPLASLLLGFKFNNPILKMLLVGYGGMGLIKNGMDNINANDSESNSLQSTSPNQSQLQQQQPRFVPYDEQPLNPRIENLQINNNILVMDIDRVPYSITLPDAVVLAYKSKSLPLSTLANAVLQKYDAAVAAARNQYEIEQGINRLNSDLNYRQSQSEVVGLK